MNFEKTTSLVAISVAVMFTVASVTGFQLSQITAEEDEEKGYTYAEGLTITGEFQFHEGVEVNQFEVFDQKTSMDSTGFHVFEVAKIVGETPLLHKLADKSYMLRNSPADQKARDNVFSVEIILSDGGDIKRSFSYSNCFVSDYEVKTQFDKEEGWNTSKGFAVTDNFEVQCSMYKPNNPVYEEAINHKEKANVKSSMEYQEEQRYFFGN